MDLGSRILYAASPDTESWIEHTGSWMQDHGHWFVDLESGSLILDSVSGILEPHGYRQDHLDLIYINCPQTRLASTSKSTLL